MTLSLLGRCERTGAFGAVISSSSPAVASRCVRVRAGVGAAASQNVTDPRLGTALLEALAAGDAAAALASVAAAAPHAEWRQLACVGTSGKGAAWSGDRTLGRAATATGEGCAAAGNLLASPDVPAAMVVAFLESEAEPLGERLVRALEAGLSAGGEEGPVRSAGLLVAEDVPWPVSDLRVDWHHDPAAELRELWTVWQPQARDYVVRALDPSAAPTYGVPGDP